jgi:predicted ATPase/class 3 adenylate cyclase
MDPTLPLPTGTISFLFTDIEGSAKLWEQHPDAMRLALARHDHLLHDAINVHGGAVFKTVGDQFCAAFPTAPQALAAALAAQRALHDEPWDRYFCRRVVGRPTPAAHDADEGRRQERLAEAGYPREAWVPGGGPPRVRMALHTDVAEPRGGDYFGSPLTRVARLLAAGHGGQVLLSQATSDRVRDAFPEGAALRDLGSHRLKDLQRPEQIYQLLHPDLPADFPPLRSLEAFAHNLPAPLTSFIGREREIAAVKQLLSTTRLLTLTGAGGCGKTRLALQVAADLVEKFADGVWLVELAALSDPALVPQTVATALGVREEPGRPLIATLTDYLRPRSLLLVLDNCEHLLVASAQLAEALLRACPNLRILSSSREALGIAGEMAYRVPSLSLPELQRLPSVEALTQFEAVRLFVDRAVASLPSFALNDQNAMMVAQVCHRLDGIPLAIELAAARVKALPVAKIAERLDDRFRLLTGGSRTALPRQQTLRALIDWSYDLLTEPEQTLLCRLSVFAGGWTSEAAEAVCADDDDRLAGDRRPATTDRFGRDTVGGRRASGRSAPGSPCQSVVGGPDVLDLLTALVEKSLVVYDEQEGQARYRLLETVRQYGRDRLLEAGEAAFVRDHHLVFFLQLATEAEPQLRGPEQARWIDCLEREYGNVRAALEWAADSGAMELGLQLGGALWWFWWMRGYLAEGRERVTQLLGRGELAAHTAVRAKALNCAGLLAFYQGDYEAARSFASESLPVLRALGQPFGIAIALSLLGQLAENEGDLQKAHSLHEESLPLWQESGDLGGFALTLNSLGDVAHSQGDDEAAWAFHERALPIWRSWGDKVGIGMGLHRLGLAACLRGDAATARALYGESLRQFREIGHPAGIVDCLEGIAGLAAAQRQAERATRLLGAAEALREVRRAPRVPSRQADYEHTIADVRAALTEEAFTMVWAEGRAMTPEEAIAHALETSDPG